MRPLKRNFEYEVTHDPDTGQERILGYKEQEDVLSDMGSVDSRSVTHKSFLDCGCDKPAASRCNECGGLSCESCQGHCQKCKKPICLEHSYFTQDNEKGEIRFCRSCYDRVVRKRMLKNIFGALIKSCCIFLLLLCGEDEDE